METAIVMPLLLTLLLAVIAVAYFDLRRTQLQNGVEVLAREAAVDPAWHNDIGTVDARVRCNGSPRNPDEAYSADGQRVLLTWHCQDSLWAYFAKLIGWSSDFTVSYEAAIPKEAPTPSPS